MYLARLYLTAQWNDLGIPLKQLKIILCSSNSGEKGRNRLWGQGKKISLGVSPRVFLVSCASRGEIWIHEGKFGGGKLEFCSLREGRFQNERTFAKRNLRLSTSHGGADLADGVIWAPTRHWVSCSDGPGGQLGSQGRVEIRLRSLWRKTGLLSPHFPQISHACVNVCVCGLVCVSVLSFSLVG